MPGNLERSSLRTEARLMTGLPAYLYRVGELLIDLIFPPRCAGCGRADAVWCERCAADLAVVPLKISLRHPSDTSTREAKRAVVTSAEPVFGTLAATGTHEGKLQDAVQALKYDHVTELASPLARRLTASLARLDWSPDLVVPVPLHRARLAERGYNQAYLLAEQVARARGLPFLPDAVYRERYTRPQVGLTRDERRLNVMNAFNAHSDQVSGKIVLMIDDVLTTGATLGSCSEALMAAGAKGVYGLTVTVARG